jgi:hypothetical protein
MVIPKSLTSSQFKPSSTLWNATHGIRARASHVPSSSGQSSTKHSLTLVRNRLRAWSEHAAVLFKKRADTLTLTTKSAFSHLGSHLNKVSGYEEIEALKNRVQEQGKFNPHLKPISDISIHRGSNARKPTGC